MFIKNVNNEWMNIDVLIDVDKWEYESLREYGLLAMKV